MLGAGLSDNLAGGTQNDVLVGKDGADILTGGKGDDLLLGGVGSDTYLYKVGDGNDTIDDPDAQSAHIMVSAADDSWSYVASAFIRDQGNPNLHESPDGRVKLVHGNTWQLQVGGGSLDLGSSFTDGDYGIHLVAAAVANTTNTITYTDTTPADDPVGVNENPSGSNTLYLGTGNDDRIILAGGAGNVLVGNGGIDSLDGGADDNRLAIYSVRHIDPAWPAEYPAGIQVPCAHGPSTSRNERPLAVPLPAAAILVERGTMEPTKPSPFNKVSRGGTPGNGAWRVAA